MNDIIATILTIVTTLGGWEAVKQAREARGLTVRELEKLTGIANSHISRIEGGRYNFTVDSVALLAKALGMDSVPLV